MGSPYLKGDPIVVIKKGKFYQTRFCLTASDLASLAAMKAEPFYSDAELAEINAKKHETSTVRDVMRAFFRGVEQAINKLNSAVTVNTTSYRGLSGTKMFSYKLPPEPPPKRIQSRSAVLHLSLGLNAILKVAVHQTVSYFHGVIGSPTMAHMESLEFSVDNPDSMDIVAKAVVAYLTGPES